MHGLRHADHRPRAQVSAAMSGDVLTSKGCWEHSSAMSSITLPQRLMPKSWLLGHRETLDMLFRHVHHQTLQQQHADAHQGSPTPARNPRRCTGPCMPTRCTCIHAPMCMHTQ